MKVINLENHRNSNLQANVGIGTAIAYFASIGTPRMRIQAWRNLRRHTKKTARQTAKRELREQTS